jgi:uncharacterized repeat protein (TIGR02059 family)
MKNTFIVIFLHITLLLQGTTYYVATNGKDGNAGTISQPFASLNYVFNKVVAGDIVYIRGGTFTSMGSTSYGISVSGKNGTSAKIISVLAYPGEIPVLDCSGLTSSSRERNGLNMDGCSYWSIKGLTIINVHEPTDNLSPGTGLTLFNCSDITLDQVNVHDCGNGFRVFGGDEIRYINCDSYQNADTKDGGNLANGFWSRVTGGGHIYYKGCRAWMNSDDGWDGFALGYGDGYIYYDKCWAFDNGEWNGIKGNGSGFKTGLCGKAAIGGIQRQLTNCLAFNNITGFDESQDVGSGYSIPHLIINCTSYNNSSCGFNFQFGAGVDGSFSEDIFRNNISYNETVAFGWNDNTLDHNSWQNGLKVSDADFINLNPEQAKGPRQADGSLPIMTFLYLNTGSDLIDAGIDVGLPFTGSAPDLGAFELDGTPVITPPAFISSAVENATPSLLTMIYDLNLSGSYVPATSSFKVTVNGQSVTINKVSVTGSKVLLTLANSVKFGDVLTVSYTKSATNQLQTAWGGIAESISNKPVTNNCINPATINRSPIAVVKYNLSCNSGFVDEIDASGSNDPDNDVLTFEWTVPANIPVSSTNSSKIRFLSPIVSSSKIMEFTVKVNDGKVIVTKSISITVLPYKPQFEIATIIYTEASSFQSPYYPKNAADGDLSTRWSVNGDDKWITFQLSDSFKISHLELAFLPEQNYSSYFDILGSDDNLAWEPILTNAASCNFSGNMQVFDFPAGNSDTAYSYLKFVGHGNSLNSWNNISEFLIFGIPQQNPPKGDSEKSDITIYPNPAVNYIRIAIKGSAIKPDKVSISDYSGKIVLTQVLNPDYNNILIPINLKSGVYIVQLGAANLTLFAQKLIVNN